MEIPDDFFYVSAPTSPASNNMLFYSVPTSPRKRAISEDHTPYQDANTDLDDDFEFETSHSFNVEVIDDNGSFHGQQLKDSLYRKQREKKQHRQRGDSLPMTMAFADELFCDGKVMPLAPPLKLPPRFHQKMNGSQSPAPSSPGSPSFALKLPFSHKRLWNDDFDPFMVALKNVKEEEKRGKAKTTKDIHNQTGLQTPTHHLGLSPHSTNCAAGSLEPTTKQVVQSPKRPFPVVETQSTPEKKIADSGGSPCKRETKGQKLRRILLRASSVGKVDDDDQSKKSERQNSAIFARKPTFLRRLSFKSRASAANCNTIVEKAAAPAPASNQLTKMTLLHFRPSLLLCIGDRARHAK